MRLELVEEAVEQAERIGAVDAGQHRRARGHRQHLARHFDDDLVGVAIGEQAGERAAAGHAVAAGIVDDDEVDAARLLAFGGKAGAGAAADDRLAARTMAWKRSSKPGRSKRGIDQASVTEDLAEVLGQRVGECGIVDLHAAGAISRRRRRWPDGALERGEQRRIGRRDRGRACPARRCSDTPPSGMRKRTGPSHAVQPLADPARPCARSPPASCASA